MPGAVHDEVAAPHDRGRGRCAAAQRADPREIGLRRSLGATRGQIRLQFLTESLLLSLLGGAGGALMGIAVTAGFAAYVGWPAVVPARATIGGLLATLVIGACAGIYPAWRAARLSPTEALTAP